MVTSHPRRTGRRLPWCIWLVGRFEFAHRLRSSWTSLPASSVGCFPRSTQSGRNHRNVLKRLRGAPFYPQHRVSHTSSLRDLRRVFASNLEHRPANFRAKGRNTQSTFAPCKSLKTQARAYARAERPVTFVRAIFSPAAPARAALPRARSDAPAFGWRLDQYSSLRYV